MNRTGFAHVTPVTLHWAAVFEKGSETAAATSKAIIVWFDYEQQATVRISEEMRERIRSFEAVAPAE